MKNVVKQIGSGFIVGTANIIPGVSGGTLLFILGLYERTLGAIGGFKPAEVRALLGHAWGAVFSRGRKECAKQFAQQANALDIPFLITLIAGVGIAILSLSSLMEYLLENQYSNTFAFFFGLIAVSVIMTTKMLKAKKAVYVIHFIAGAAVTLAVTLSVDPAINAGVKSERYRMILEAEEAAAASVPAAQQNDTDASNESAALQNDTDTLSVSAAASSSTRLKYTGQYSPAELTGAAIAGGIAISAMILPGLSGSLVLILMGQYYEVISAISNLKTLQLDYFVFLSIMSVGMLAGILAFSRLLTFVFKRFYNGTVAFLIGLTFGSLYALWPFKEAVMMDQYVKEGGVIKLMEDTIVMSNVGVLPDDAMSAVFALIFCLAGVGIMVALDRYGDARK